MRTIHLRELYQSRNPLQIAQADSILELYYPLLKKAFPLEGEIETPATYRLYLLGSDPEWYMVVVIDDREQILGGVQYQILRNVAAELPVLAWVEHVWLIEEARTYANFLGMMVQVLSKLASEGVVAIFMEFNDPAKMSPDEIDEDAKAGVLTNDRTWFWGAVGLSELVSEYGTVVPYAQPSMEGQPPVKYLTAGWYLLGSTPLQGISIDTYLEVIRRAHSTIPGVNPDVDTTSLDLVREVTALPNKQLRFRKLSERFPEREV